MSAVEPLEWHRLGSGEGWWASYRSRRGAELRYVAAVRDGSGGFEVQVRAGTLDVRPLRRLHFDALEDVRRHFDRRPSCGRAATGP